MTFVNRNQLFLLTSTCIARNENETENISEGNRINEIDKGHGYTPFIDRPKQKPVADVRRMVVLFKIQRYS